MTTLILFTVTFLLLVIAALKLNIIRRLVISTMVLLSIVSALIAFWIEPKIFKPSISTTAVISAVIALFIFLLIIILRFFRDPNRNTIFNNGDIISPADGTVRYVKKVKAGEIAFSEKKGRTFPLKELTHTDIVNDGAYVVGIEMSIIDVHVNRSPVKGVLKLIHCSPGKFLSLRNIDSVLKNERVTTLFQGDDIKIGVVQIASRLVRRIIVFKKVGDRLSAGERFGRIIFGSQVDVVIPEVPRLKINVKQGDFVHAGISVIAKYL